MTYFNIVPPNIHSNLRPLYDEALNELAEFVGSDPENLVFVQNATTGVNTVVKNLHLKEEDVILVNSHTYGAVTFSVDSAIRRAGADLLQIDITMPIRSEEQIVEQVEIMWNCKMFPIIARLLQHKHKSTLDWVFLKAKAHGRHQM